MDWSYEAWPSGEPYQWEPAERGENPYDLVDFHVDLGAGTLKKGRIGIDRHPAPGVNIVMDLDRLEVFAVPEVVGGDAAVGIDIAGLPFDDSSIESIISHHCLEHVTDGFIRLVDEVYRVLVPGGLFRAITPLFPSRTAVEDPDHKRYFMEGTWDTFLGEPGEPHWHEAFSVPYTKARFRMLDKDVTPAMDDLWGPDGAREIRVALEARK